MTPIPLRPETLIEQGRQWTLALNVNQNLLGKTMLVLERSCTSATELTTDEWEDLLHQMRRVQTAVTSLFAPDQFNFAFLMNADAQVHLHVVPRYASERTWRGLTFDDPHFGELFGKEERVLHPDQLRALSDAIRERLPR